MKTYVRDERTIEDQPLERLRQPIREGVDFQDVPDLLRLQGRYYEMAAAQRQQAVELES